MNNHTKNICELINVTHPRDIRWAHGINTIIELHNVLNDYNIDFIEADIQYLDNNPIMAHDNNQWGPLFSDWLRILMQSNRKIGTKLDFKSIHAHHSVLEELNKCHAFDKFPIWINADVLKGPNGNVPMIPAVQFISDTVELCPDAILSLGWTTGSNLIPILAYLALPLLLLVPFVVMGACFLPVHDGLTVTISILLSLLAYFIIWSRYNIHTIEYSKVMIDNMLQLCKQFNVQQCTFALRECYIEASITQIKRLLNENSNYSLTVWRSNRHDIVSNKWKTLLEPNLPVYEDIPSPLFFSST